MLLGSKFIKLAMRCTSKYHTRTHTYCTMAPLSAGTRCGGVCAIRCGAPLWGSVSVHFAHFDRCPHDIGARALGCEKAVEILVQSKADLSAESVVPCNEGMSPTSTARILTLTPLMTAIYFCKHGIVELLLAAGADASQGTETGTPLSLAAWRRDATSVRLLIAAGVSVDARVSDGITALHLVTESGDLEIVRQLLEANAVVDVTTAASDRKGRQRSPLWIAAKAGDMELVRVLLDARAYANLQSGPRSTTPLLESCVAGSIEMVRVFIERQGDVNKVGPDG